MHAVHKNAHICKNKQYTKIIFKVNIFHQGKRIYIISPSTIFNILINTLEFSIFHYLVAFECITYITIISKLCCLNIFRTIIIFKTMHY